MIVTMRRALRGAMRRLGVLAAAGAIGVAGAGCESGGSGGTSARTIDSSSGSMKAGMSGLRADVQGDVHPAGPVTRDEAHGNTQGNTQGNAQGNASGGAQGMAQDAAAVKTAVAVLKPSRAATTQPAMNNVTGTLTFTQRGNQVQIVGEVRGLKPNSKHGIHIHEKADMSSPDLMSTGGHYNPEGHPHAGPDAGTRHAGDFGNLTADANGLARINLTVDNISLGGPKNDVVGLPVIVHASPDDLKSQPAGNAGARVAGGLIEMKK